jgi:hypothetical protein
MATTTDAQKIEKYRAAANDKTIPQDARNQLLDRANEIERKAYEATKKLAKGGMVEKAPMKKAMAKGGDMKKKMADKAMPKGKPTGVVGKPSGVAILITPAKKLAKGGMAKKKC